MCRAHRCSQATCKFKAPVRAYGSLNRRKAGNGQSGVLRLRGSLSRQDVIMQACLQDQARRRFHALKGRTRASRRATCVRLTWLTAQVAAGSKEGRCDLVQDSSCRPSVQLVITYTFARRAVCHRDPGAVPRRRVAHAE